MHLRLACYSPWEGEVRTRRFAGSGRSASDEFVHVSQQPFDQRWSLLGLYSTAQEGGESSRLVLLKRDHRGGVVAVPDAEADVSVVAQVAGGSQSDGVGLDQRVTAEVFDELRSLRSRAVRTEPKAVAQLTVAL